MSGYRVSETIPNQNRHSDLAYDSEEGSESGELESSSSDMLNQIDDINEFMFKARDRKASLTVQLPKDMCPLVVKENSSSFVFELRPKEEG